MIIYLAGQTSFGNRGCEALVRGTINILTAELGVGHKFLVPSVLPAEDADQWPGHEDCGVEFVSAPAMPSALKTWCSIAQRVPGLAGLEPPVPHYSAAVEADLQRSDAVLMIGGDIISLDYGVHSLYMWSKLIDRARKIGKPTYLWAASVGPFDANARVVSAMRRHLTGYAGMSVRESSSEAYMRDKFGLSPALVGDPAFRLSVDCPRESLGVDVGRLEGAIGFNISPLVRDIAASKPDAAAQLEAEFVAFLQWLANARRRMVVLIYHVDQQEKPDNSDLTYLRRLQDLANLGPQCYCLPPGLNACELKWVISRLEALVAARTHATIAAFSQGVPAVSIGYSRKAKALNMDLFGTTEYVVDSKALRSSILQQALDSVLANRQALSATLKTKAAQLAQSALTSARMLKVV